jgi:hypothetical protein
MPATKRIAACRAPGGVTTVIFWAKPLASCRQYACCGHCHNQRRICRRRHATLPWTTLPAVDWGVSAGLVFGGSETRLYGYVSNIRRPSDVAGVYGGVGAGAALLVGARAIVLRNQKGAVLRLSGRQVGLIANADLSGLAIRLR